MSPTGTLDRPQESTQQHFEQRSGQPFRHEGGNRDRPHLSSRQTGIEDFNVGDTERWISLVGGGALTAYGLLRGTWCGLGMALAGGALIYRGATGHCDVYGMLGISTAEKHSPQASIPADHGVKVQHTETINRSPDELYKFWRHVENLPRVMSHVEAVRRLEGHRSHWVAKGPLGIRVEWDAEIINDKTNELIAWRSLEGSAVDTAGSVHFRRVPGGRGTEVTVTLKYNPPAGKVGAAIAKFLGEAPEQQIREDLGQFKKMMERGQGYAI